MAIMIVMVHHNYRDEYQIDVTKSDGNDDGKSDDNYGGRGINNKWVVDYPCPGQEPGSLGQSSDSTTMFHVLGERCKREKVMKVGMLVARSTPATIGRGADGCAGAAGISGALVTGVDNVPDARSLDGVAHNDNGCSALSVLISLQARIASSD
ncbi:hypothetical protein M426DRAFT_318180 [Hypoxylon sp. CI-4A]|nr:hypothetical protein M426DRAFT_318180 [Hypoxylon sp. CI-4A]